MKDLIDERNRREKMKNSVVKWWNVNWVTVEKKKDEFAGLSAEEKQTAKAILNRLDAEAAEDEAVKAKEVEDELKKQESREAAYNAATGSYSGDYGTKPVDDVAEMDQITKILKEKEESFFKNLEDTRTQVDGQEE